MGTKYVVDETGSLTADGQIQSGDATNNVTISSDGIALSGTAEVINTKSLGVVAFADMATPPTTALIGASSFVKVFNDTVVNAMTITLKMPLDYKAGTDIDIYYVWAPSNTNTGNVRWRVTYKLIEDGASINPSSVIITKITAAPGVSEQRTSTGPFSIPGSLITSDTSIIIAVDRHASAAGDTYTGDAYLLNVYYTYTLDSLGD